MTSPVHASIADVAENLSPVAEVTGIPIPAGPQPTGAHDSGISALTLESPALGALRRRHSPGAAEDAGRRPLQPAPAVSPAPIRQYPGAAAGSPPAGASGNMAHYGAGLTPTALLLSRPILGDYRQLHGNPVFDAAANAALKVFNDKLTALGCADRLPQSVPSSSIQRLLDAEITAAKKALKSALSNAANRIDRPLPFAGPSKNRMLPSTGPSGLSMLFNKKRDEEAQRLRDLEQRKRQAEASRRKQQQDLQAQAEFSSDSEDED